MEGKEKESPIYSQAHSISAKEKEFREYLVKKDVILALVKVLLSLRNATERPTKPLKVLQDYFGEYHDTKSEDFDKMKKEMEQLISKNKSLSDEKEELEKKIVVLKEQKLKKEAEAEEEKKKELENQQKKKPPVKK